jgi:hypothetical protein
MIGVRDKMLLRTCDCALILKVLGELCNFSRKQGKFDEI